jgi:hypothetical protein
LAAAKKLSGKSEKSGEFAGFGGGGGDVLPVEAMEFEDVDVSVDSLLLLVLSFMGSFLRNSPRQSLTIPVGG